MRGVESHLSRVFQEAGGHVSLLSRPAGNGPGMQSATRLPWGPSVVSECVLIMCCVRSPLQTHVQQKPKSCSLHWAPRLGVTEKRVRTPDLAVVLNVTLGTLCHKCKPQGPQV